MLLPQPCDISRSDTNPSGTHFTAHFELNESLPYLDGHFDKRAVLPGVTHIGWAIELAERCTAQKVEFAQLKALKCTRLVLPPVHIKLTVEYRPEQKELRFKTFANNERCASGVINVSVNATAFEEVTA